MAVEDLGLDAIPRAANGKLLRAKVKEEVINKLAPGANVGLYGDDTLALTRSIVPTHPLEIFYCRVMLNENYHASHHKKASIKWTDLPDDTETLCKENEDVRKLTFDTYIKAIPQMLKELKDPRIGSQWLLDGTWPGQWPKEYFRSKGGAIEGGTDEIQKDTIAKRVLGRPRPAALEQSGQISARSN